MIEEPYRWLEAISNRREYVREQIKGGSPVLAASLPGGVLLLGVGAGNSKVFEVFDRQGMAGLGHPSDLEKIRQAAIDSAHVEAFTRAPEDVSMRRLVSFSLSPQIKTNFEQIFNAPFLMELLFAELGQSPDTDLLLRMHYDGSFQLQHGGIMVAAPDSDTEAAALAWLKQSLPEKPDRSQAAEILMQAWWMITEKTIARETPPSESERREGWRNAVRDKVLEAGWLNRAGARANRYQSLNRGQLGL